MKRLDASAMFAGPRPYPAETVTSSWRGGESAITDFLSCTFRSGVPVMGGDAALAGFTEGTRGVQLNRAPSMIQ